MWCGTVASSSRWRHWRRARRHAGPPLCRRLGLWWPAGAPGSAGGVQAVGEPAVGRGWLTATGVGHRGSDRASRQRSLAGRWSGAVVDMATHTSITAGNETSQPGPATRTRSGPPGSAAALHTSRRCGVHARGGRRRAARESRRGGGFPPLGPAQRLQGFSQGERGPNRRRTLLGAQERARPTCGTTREGAPCLQARLPAACGIPAHRLHRVAGPRPAQIGPRAYFSREPGALALRAPATPLRQSQRAHGLHEERRGGRGGRRGAGGSLRLAAGRPGRRRGPARPSARRCIPQVRRRALP